MVSLPDDFADTARRELRLREVPFLLQEEAFKLVLERASRWVGACSPFLDADGIRAMMPAFQEVILRGVRLEVVTRAADEQVQQRKGLDALSAAFRQQGRSDLLSVRTFHHQRPGTYGALRSSVHAKIFVADTDHAYVGSGEMRLNSFRKNFEMGFLVEGDLAANARGVFETISSYARPYDPGGPLA